MLPGNITRVLAARETGQGATWSSLRAGVPDIQSRLEEWQEDDFIHHSSAKYGSFQPSPRSTIALSYNCSGTLLASTHGDHTVKITCCVTQQLQRVLTGHRRTPWVVRFHPRRPSLLASGSLDHEVRLWDVRTGQCLLRFTFGKPIASLAFHATLDVLAVGCGHKVYMWEYGASLLDGAPAEPRAGEAGAGRGADSTPALSQRSASASAAHAPGTTGPAPAKGPTIVLKTRRSMRAVHFHPGGLPLLLTAEVQDALPTAQLPPSLTQHGAYVDGRGFGGRRVSSSSEAQAGPSGRGRQAPPSASAWAAAGPESGGLLPSMVDLGWELPFPSSLFREDAGGDAGGALLGLGDAALAVAQAQDRARGGQAGHGARGTPADLAHPPAAEVGQSGDALHMQHHVIAAFSTAALQIIGDEQPPRVRLRLWRFDPAAPAAPLDAAAALQLEIGDAILCSEMGVHFSPCGRFLAAAVACRAPLVPQQPPAAARAGRVPSPAPLRGAEAFRPASSGPVSGREREEASSGVAGAAGPGFGLAGEDMQVDVPGGGFAPALELDALLARDPPPPPPGAPPAPPHPPPLERVAYELRIVSVVGREFGSVLRARRIRAAHCLTSVRFSPTSGHVLLAYGKKHISLLRSLALRPEGVTPLHTILEVLEVEDMRTVRVLPAPDDEINAALFHPLPGGGIAYGTKEGKLRLVAHDRARRAVAEETAALLRPGRLHARLAAASFPPPLRGENLAPGEPAAGLPGLHADLLAAPRRLAAQAEAQPWPDQPGGAGSVPEASAARTEATRATAAPARPSYARVTAAQVSDARASDVRVSYARPPAAAQAADASAAERFAALLAARREGPAPWRSPPGAPGFRPPEPAPGTAQEMRSALTAQLEALGEAGARARE